MTNYGIFYLAFDMDRSAIIGVDDSFEGDMATVYTAAP